MFYKVHIIKFTNQAYIKMHERMKNLSKRLFHWILWRWFIYLSNVCSINYL